MSWRNLQTVLSLPCILLQPLSFRIPGSVFPIPPTPAIFDQLMVDVGLIAQEHVSQRLSVLVLAMGLEDNISPEDER